MWNMEDQIKFFSLIFDLEHEFLHQFLTSSFLVGKAAQAATYLFLLWSVLCMLKHLLCQKITMTLWTDD